MSASSSATAPEKNASPPCWNFEMPGYNPISEDLCELIRLLKSHNVEFIIVGAHALAFYVPPRFTEDIDIFVRRSQLNGGRLQAALREFGIPIDDSARDQLVGIDKRMIILGVKPNQVDFLNYLDGVDFADAWTRKKQVTLAQEEVPILSLEDIIATKKATGRPKDKYDLAVIEEYHSG